MNSRWVALGIVGAALWLGATFGIVYAAVDLAGDDTQVVVEAPEAEGGVCEEAVAYFSAIDDSFRFFLDFADEHGGALDETGTLSDSFLISDYTDALSQMIAVCSR